VSKNTGAKTEHILQRLADFFFRHRPQPCPVPARLAQGRIISHRGEHDNRKVMENTVAAFTRAADAGVWGMELDVRWTRDQVPVVVHDPDLKRLYDSFQRIREISYKNLKANHPLIPGLDEIVSRFGGRLHLMIEIKDHLPPEAEKCNQALRKILAPLTPGRDYHLMALRSRILEGLDGFPPRAKVAIAHYWPGKLSRKVAAKQWGGLCAHYLLMPSHLIRKHHRLQQYVGVGYAASRNSLLRELNRGVDWIFSNDAIRIQGELNAMQKRAGVFNFSRHF
jgi:glycerophosphoryl diester phosphodiesterase